MSLMQGAAGIGGGLAGLFGKKKNPSDAANRELDKIPGMVSPYVNPYIDMGKEQLNQLLSQYGTLTNNPAEMYNKFAEGYTESPGYQHKLKQALTAAQNATAAGGMLGTPLDQVTQGEVAGDIASKDYEDYLNHIAGLYGLGLSGTQGLENQGYGAATDYASMLAGIQGQKAQNQFAGQDWQNRSNAANWSNIFGGLGSLGAGYFGSKNPWGG